MMKCVVKHNLPKPAKAVISHLISIVLQHCRLNPDITGQANVVINSYSPLRPSETSLMEF